MSGSGAPRLTDEEIREMISAADIDKDDKISEEEFFRMCLLSHQLAHKHNQKILLLDARSLYQEVTKKRKLPFFKWNEWLRK